MSEKILPPGFQLRPASFEDLPGVVAISQAEAKNHNDPLIALNLNELQASWQEPGVNIQTDACVVIAPDGQVVGYEEGYQRVPHVDLHGDGYVHPDFKNLGIGTSMLRWLKGWANGHMQQAEPGLQVILSAAISNDEKEAHSLLRNEGFEPNRYFWKMKIDMQAPPEPFPAPEGISLLSFDVDAHMRPLYDAHNEAFADHWGFVPKTYEQFVYGRTVERELNPELWLVAWENGQIAGYALCRELEDYGWVDTLGVRRAWRKRGLGLYLLKQAFALFHQRGQNSVALTVDSASLTGATRLYERAGMKQDKIYVNFEQQLRPGRKPDPEA